jgi:hypothetical protein
MDMKSSLRSYLVPAIILFVLGWGGLALLLNLTEPFLWPRWFFYFLLVFAGTGSALPFTLFFNIRFPTNPPADPSVVGRQAVWVGVYLSMLAWLKMGDALTFSLGVGIAGGIIAIEYLLRVREQAQKPKPAAPDEQEEPSAKNPNPSEYVG